MKAPLTASELADALGVTVPTVQAWANQGLIPFSQIGRQRYFNLIEVLAATRKPARPVKARCLALASQDDEFTELRQWVAARRGGRTATGTKKAERSR